MSLLQQFFYHEKDSEIPDSKFQKTKKKNKLTLFICVLLIILFCISFAFVFQNLNTYLDEILYFFSVSKYEVVFIEDLDRFDQSDIFVKLRELNQLINNSKKVKQNVVFVYAIKDDMFMNKERTKFFDFIIPVIPVINNSNSKDKLQTVLKFSSYTNKF